MRQRRRRECGRFGHDHPGGRIQHQRPGDGFGRTIPFGVSSGSVAVTSATAAVYEAAADTLLARNVSGGGNTGRSVKEALYVLRNKVDAGAGIVYATDDTTSSWAFTVSTLAGNPIVAIDPA
jgi:hypothetical protein